MRTFFFDHASTTPCGEAALVAARPFEAEQFGNPSSAHAMGQLAAKAITEARRFFARHFNVEPAQVIFTSGGTESDNLAIQGTALRILAHKTSARSRETSSATGSLPFRSRVLYSASEHPAVRETMQALRALGFDARELALDSEGQVALASLDEQLSSPDEIALVSIQQVNNILGTHLPVAELAARVKARAPGALFHTDAVQAFGKIRVPTAPSAVDFVSISAHKLHGPKGVGALIVLDTSLLGQKKLRPLLFGGGQEDGLRSGTQSAALIAGFHAAAEAALPKQEATWKHLTTLRAQLREGLRTRGILDSALRWNSPESAVPHINSLSVLDPRLPAAAFSRLLEEDGCMISTGSACHSGKAAQPELALAAIGLSPALASAGIRVSFSATTQAEEVGYLIASIARALDRLRSLTPGARPTRNPSPRAGT